MVREGRWRTYRRTALLVGFLFLLQVPMRQVATADWSSVADIPTVVPVRLSLLLDLGMILAYVILAFRAVELVFSKPPDRTSRRLDAWLAFSLVLLAAAMDVVENVVLWVDAGFDSPAYPDLSLSGWTWVMRGLVVFGLLLGLAAPCWSGSGEVGAAEEPAPKRNVAPRPNLMICCSGGGIRAASFCLGGLQSLRKEYAKADAVVGVSGGGYMAAALHVLRWQSANADDEGPEKRPVLEPPAYAQDSPEEKWLRRHTRYLFESPQVGVFAMLSLLFGIAVNLIFLTALIGGAVWVIGWFLLASGGLSDWLSDDGVQTLDYSGDWAWVGWGWIVLAAGATLFVFAKFVDRFKTFDVVVRQRVRTLIVRLLVIGAALLVVFVGLPTLLAALQDYASDQTNALADLLQLMGFGASETRITGTGNEIADGDTSGSAVSAASLAVVTATLIAAVRSIASAVNQEDGDDADSLPRKWLTSLWKKVKGVVLPWAASILVLSLLVVVFLTWTAQILNDSTDLERWELAGLFGGLVLAAFVLTDANRTSLHHFYRERLSSAYLVRRTATGAPQQIDYSEALRFSQSAPQDGGPRLVSCAVANVTDFDVVPTDRDCTSFVFGHDVMGLTDEILPDGATVPSAVYEFAADFRYRDATIPAALAISGAAFSPLAGRENARIAPYRLVLALANARLGVWLPNPLWVDPGAIAARRARYQSSWQWRRWEATRALFTKPNPFLVTREAFGRTSVLDRFLYVTDGGHYDNLGLVEALRGNPREVIVLDASNDPEDSFRTLGRAVATARMDLGCDIEINPREMRKVGEERAAAAWGRGTISYRDRDPDTGQRLTGDLWLAKCIMLADLPWDVETYSADNPSFPRTSTGNQLYGEFDVEAYRMLGQEVTRRMLRARARV